MEVDFPEIILQIQVIVNTISGLVHWSIGGSKQKLSNVIFVDLWEPAAHFAGCSE